MQTNNQAIRFEEALTRASRLVSASLWLFVFNEEPVPIARSLFIALFCTIYCCKYCSQLDHFLALFLILYQNFSSTNGN